MNITAALKDLQKDPGARERFLMNGLPPYVAVPMDPRPMVRLPSPALAKTLKASPPMAGVLYKGALAKSIADDVRGMGGYLSEEDLATVAPPEREPLKISYADRTIHVLPG